MTNQNLIVRPPPSPSRASGRWFEVSKTGFVYPLKMHYLLPMQKFDVCMLGAGINGCGISENLADILKIKR